MTSRVRRHCLKHPPVPRALAIALRANPALLASHSAATAREYDVRVAAAGTSPRIGVGVTGTYAADLSSGSAAPVPNSQSRPNVQTGINMTLPLYQGGLPAARIRQAQALRSQDVEGATAVERSVVSQVRTAYAAWRSLEGAIAAAEVAVNADRLSLEGVRAENGVGARTVLDVLNAQQELLGAEVTLARVRHDAYVARFALQAAMGLADAQELGLEL